MNMKYENRYLHLSLNIAYYRKRLGLSQLQLAERAGISRTHMSNIEATGVEKGMSLETLFAIADVLEVAPGKLLEVRE